MKEKVRNCGLNVKNRSTFAQKLKEIDMKTMLRENQVISQEKKILLEKVVKARRLRIKISELLNFKLKKDKSPSFRNRNNDSDTKRSNSLNNLTV